MKTVTISFEDVLAERIVSWAVSEGLASEGFDPLKTGVVNILFNALLDMHNAPPRHENASLDDRRDSDCIGLGNADLGNPLVYGDFSLSITD
jgi:hypothetical protein